MLCLMARLPVPQQRLGLLDNVLEEHGDFDSARFHAATFRRFCGSLGVDETVLDQDRPGPAVTAFNLALWGLCQTQTPEHAFAGLGIIELAFAQISATIGKTVVERGWLPADRLVHYRLHAELDIEHAAELSRATRLFEQPPIRQTIVAGLELGAYLFDRLYRDLV
jgi:pyrroloquinoline-quinone synthase